MRKVHLLFLAVATVLFSCEKEKEMPVYAVNVSPGSTLSSARSTVLLKDVVESSLPSPYYHFEYDSSGKVIFVSFASDLTRYDVVYRRNKISEMKNNILVNKDRLKYVYDSAGRVSTVRYTDSTGAVYAKVDFFYDGKKLIKLKRKQKSGTGFTTDKIMTFTYHTDGNLLELNYHYLPFKGQTEATFTDRFEQYDNKINVDDFGLIHNDFFDHLILLPKVQLQRNNPRKETRTGDGLNYVVKYTYTYNNDNAPLIKAGELTISNGSDAGKKIQIQSTFSYY